MNLRFDVLYGIKPVQQGETFMGIRLIANDAFFTEIKEVRVLGGYMNRWLIRAFEPRPKKTMVHDRVNNIIYAHSSVINQLKEQIRRESNQDVRAASSGRHYQTRGGQW